MTSGLSLCRTLLQNRACAHHIRNSLILAISCRLLCTLCYAGKLLLSPMKPALHDLATRWDFAAKNELRVGDNKMAGTAYSHHEIDVL